jgi:antitoxin (DNA-binding transcriptional repressor) of toxin-antitoxin stability system
MKAASVRELRNEFPKVERWLRAGEEVRLTKRGQVLGTIIPAAAPRTPPAEWPDFMARLQAIYGDKVTSDSQAIFDDMRADRA